MLSREEIFDRNCTPLEDLIAEDFGALGTPEREKFEMDCDAFILGERLREEREKAGFSQMQLAEKVGINKSLISKIENGFSDVKLSSLVKIFSALGLSLDFTLNRNMEVQMI